jgi:hypothetical protein
VAIFDCVNPKERGEDAKLDSLGMGATKLIHESMSFHADSVNQEKSESLNSYKCLTS